MATSLNKLDGLYSASSNHTDIMTHCYFSLLINSRAYVKAVIIKIQSHKAAKSSQFWFVY